MPDTIAVTPTGRGTFHVAPPSGPRIEVLTTEAEDLANQLRAAVFDNAPPMARVIGYDDGECRVLNPEQTAAAQAEGWDLEHGLACPHDQCDHVAWAGHGTDAVIIVDVDERWSRAGYDREDDGERVTTGGTDADYAGLGYRCPTCYKPITLPDGIEEDWT